MGACCIVRLTWHQHLPPVAPSIALELHNVPMLEPQELKRLLVQYCIDCCSCPLVFSLWEYVGPTLDRLDRGMQLEPNGKYFRQSHHANLSIDLQQVHRPWSEKILRRHSPMMMDVMLHGTTPGRGAEHRGETACHGRGGRRITICTSSTGNSTRTT